MKKFEKYIYLVFIVILIGALSSTITYIVLNNKTNNQNVNNKNENNSDNENNNMDLKNTVKFKNITTSNSKIIETFDIVMNNKKSVFEIEYSSKNDEANAIINIKLPETKQTLMVDLNEHTTFENFNTDYLKNYIKENNFQFIKGEDNKDYLLVVVEAENFSGGPSAYLYAYDDDMNLVTGDVSYDSCSNDEMMAIVYGPTSNETVEEPGKSGYRNNFNLTKKYDDTINVKIEGDKVYYLKADYNAANDEIDGILEERIYTIKNSKWEYKIKNKFKIITSSGATC